MKPIEEGLAQVVISNKIGCSSYVNSDMLIGRDARVEVVEESKPAAIDLGSTLLEEEQTKTPPLVRNIKSMDDCKEELQRWIEMDDIILGLGGIPIF